MRPCDKRRLDAITRQEQQEARAKASPPKEPSKYIAPVPCTWADAELVFPGVTAEWRGMMGQKGTCVPPIGFEYKVALGTYPDRASVLFVTQLDPEKKWHSPPEWCCVVDRKDSTQRIWTHPMPMPHSLLLYMDYTYTSPGPTAAPPSLLGYGGKLKTE